MSRSLADGITFTIDRDNITVGRENDSLFVEDLNSANSTYVNNQKIFDDFDKPKNNLLSFLPAERRGQLRDCFSEIIGFNG